MPTYSPEVLRKIKELARARAIKQGIIRRPNREEDGVAVPKVARPKVLLSDLHIRTKDKRVIPFVPNRVQTKYLDKDHPQWREGIFNMRGLREIILKGRQFGFSTLILALFYLDTVNNDNTESVLVAHDSDSTQKMFRMIHLFHERLPDAKRPAIKAANRRELVYPDLNSTFRVMTAGTSTSGHSSTLNNLHCSEVSRWVDPDIFVGLMQAVTRDGNVFEESTANGMGKKEIGSEGEEIITGSAFHVYYEDAKAGIGEFRAHFYAWFEHDEYQTEPPEGWKLLTIGDDPKALLRYGNEVEIKAKFGLTDAQMYWRHCKMDEHGMGPGNFKSQYPATDTECFDVNKQKFFDDWDELAHVMDPIDIPDHWERFGAYDWGFGSPFCFLAFAVDPHMNVFVTHELYDARVTDPEQAILVRDLLKDLGMFDDTVWADSSIWAVKMNTDGTSASNVDAFLDQGVCMVPAIKNTQHAWGNMRAFLRESVKEHDWKKSKRSVRIFRTDGKGAGCPNLIRTLPQMKRNPLAPEKLLEIENRRPVEDHACFVAGTMVTTDHGEVPIEQIKIGDSVLTREGYQFVTGAMMTCSSALIYEAKFGLGITLNGTFNHPIWTIKGFVSMGILDTDDWVLTRHEEEYVLRPGPFSVETQNEYHPVYNITVGTNGDGEYFANRVLVSNCATLSYGLSHFIVPGEEEKEAPRSQSQQLMDDGMLKSRTIGREIW